MVFQAGLAAAGAEPELLEPERAFQLSAVYKDSKTVELRYKIAEGYYMYRGRFKFDLGPVSAARLGKATFPKGNMKQDPTFGRVETYRDSVRILLPVTSMGKRLASSDAPALHLKVTAQGCADAGVCYPPMRQTLTLLPATLGVVLADSTPGGSTRGGPQSISETLKKSK